MLSVLRTPKVVTAQHCWGLLGAGVPPLLGALALLAYWVALDAVGWGDSYRYHGATLLGLLGAGVPPLLGAHLRCLLGSAGCCCRFPYLPLIALNSPY